MQPRLSVAPCTQADAFALVDRWHRHHDPPIGCTMCLACYDEADGRVVGVAVLGRPVARMWQDGATWEVLRVATDGTANACSALYGAAGRIARVLGLRLVTYTLPQEGGASLRGAGWTCDGQQRRDGKGWASRAGRKDDQPDPKTRWVLDARRGHPALVWPVEEAMQPLLLVVGK